MVTSIRSHGKGSLLWECNVEKGRVSKRAGQQREGPECGWLTGRQAREPSAGFLSIVTGSRIPGNHKGGGLEPHRCWDHGTGDKAGPFCPMLWPPVSPSTLSQ